MATSKQIVLEIVSALPEDCSLEDVIDAIGLRARVEEGLMDLDNGRRVRHAQAMREARDRLSERG